MDRELTLKERLAHNYLCAIISGLNREDAYLLKTDWSNNFVISEIDIKQCFELAEKFIEISNIHKTN